MDAIANFVGALISTPFLCVGWIVVGVAAGSLARQVTGTGEMHLLSDTVLGLMGAFIGGLIASLFGFYQPEGGIDLLLVNLLLASLGAVLLIAAGHVLTEGMWVQH